MSDITLEDILIATRTVFGEARGEDDLGKRAVAHVLINRWRTTTGQFRKDDSLAEACIRDMQFSAWNDSDPNRALIRGTTLADDVFRSCMIAVLDALNSDSDPTLGACHYHTKAISPNWADPSKITATIGNHIFYAGIA